MRLWVTDAIHATRGSKASRSFLQEKDLEQLKYSNICMTGKRREGGVYLLGRHEIWKVERHKSLQEGEDKEKVHVLEGRWGGTF